MSKKPALLFAHRGEAYSFLEQGKLENLRAIGPVELQAYETDSTFLLITQEGTQETTENLTWFLASFGEQVSILLNFGLAGALTQKLVLEQIYQIKTIYGEEQFKSYQAANTGNDLISAKTRITNSETAKTLSMTAALVDREAWAMASVAKKFKKEFLCYKIVSDFADSEKVCLLVKEKSQELSDKLFTFYQTLDYFPQHKTTPTLDLPGFHLTFTQQKQIETILSRLSLKENKPTSDFLDASKLAKIRELKIQPKEKTQVLIHELAVMLNPFKKEFEEKLNQATLPLTQIGCRVKFTAHYENKNFTLSMSIENEKNFERLQIALSQTSYQEITKVLDGEF